MQRIDISTCNRKNIMTKKKESKRLCFYKQNQARCFYTSLHFQCKFKCTVLISKFTRFCRYSMLLFSTKKVKWCDIISLTVRTFIKKKKKCLKREIKRRAWLFWTQCTRKVCCLLLISKRVFNERLHILVLFIFYLFVCTFWLWNLFIFPPRKWDPIYL